MKTLQDIEYDESFVRYSCPECGFTETILKTVPHETDRKCYACNVLKVTA